MDDYGNDYQDDAWFTTACVAHSLATFGMLCDGAIMDCIMHCADYAAQDI